MFKRNKFGAKKTTCTVGHVHDSKKEAARCGVLHQMHADGLISDLVLQPQFWFTIDGQQIKHRNGRRVGYRSDFEYREGGKLICEEVKGFTARDWPLRAAIFIALYPQYTLREI